MGNGGRRLPVLVRRALEHKTKRGKMKGRVQWLRRPGTKLGKGSNSLKRSRDANSLTADVSKLDEILLSVSKAARVSNVAARRKRGIE